ncbi:hypothetical protein [Methylorubrum zatmanii]
MRNRSLTRRELYDLVWSIPMTKLATEFGISDVGLKKVCNRHRIPTPTRGYWAKLEAGQKPKQALFAAVKDARLNQVEVGGNVVVLAEPVRQVIEARRAERRLERRRPPAPEPVVFEPVATPHPAVRRTVQALRRCKQTDAAVEAIGEGLCGVSVGRESIERAAYVLDVLARLLAERGHQLEPTGVAMKVEVGLDKAVMVLREKTRIVDHVPTVEELAAQARRDEQWERYYRNPSRWPTPPYGKAYPEKDKLWLGELSLQIEGHGDGVRRSWADGCTQRLEGLVPSIVAGIEVLLVARKTRREARDEQARQWAELRRRRELAKARQEREKSRAAFFDGLLRLRRDADDLRKALAEMTRDVRSGDHEQVARMMAWGEERLRGMEKRLKLEWIEGGLTEAKLFPLQEQDELFDPLGEPPQSSYY